MGFNATRAPGATTMVSHEKKTFHLRRRVSCKKKDFTRNKFMSFGTKTKKKGLEVSRILF